MGRKKSRSVSNGTAKVEIIFRLAKIFLNFFYPKTFPPIIIKKYSYLCRNKSIKAMALAEYEIWWASLPIAEKERIAAKAIKKVGIDDESLALYPACTRWWESLPSDRRIWIKKHCEAAHGDILKDWDEANPYGD